MNAAMQMVAMLRKYDLVFIFSEFQGVGYGRYYAEQRLLHCAGARWLRRVILEIDDKRAVMAVGIEYAE